MAKYGDIITDFLVVQFAIGAGNCQLLCEKLFPSGSALATADCPGNLRERILTFSTTPTLLVSSLSKMMGVARKIPLGTG